MFTKDSDRSTVHRRTLLDYVGVRLLDADGTVVGERRFLGVLAAGAYAESVLRIPVLAAKAADIIARSGYEPGSHGAKTMLAVINTYPRDELFRASVDELFPIVDRIAGLTERRQVRLFVHKDPWQRYVSCLGYLPRHRDMPQRGHQRPRPCPRRRRSRRRQRPVPRNARRRQGECRWL